MKQIIVEWNENGETKLNQFSYLVEAIRFQIGLEEQNINSKRYWPDDEKD